MKINKTPFSINRGIWEKYLKLRLAVASLHPLKINFVITYIEVSQKRKKEKIGNSLMKHCILDSFV